MTTSELLLTAFTINLGIALGAGLYETRIVLPLWFTKKGDGNYGVDFEAMRNIDTGRKFWGFVTTMPLTLLTIANLIFALRSAAPLHDWWLAASVIVLLERISTFVFFMPTAIKLQKGDNMPPSTIFGMVTWWKRLNYGRNMLTFVAIVLVLKAMLAA